MFVRLTDLSASVCLFAAFLVQINFKVFGSRNNQPIGLGSSTLWVLCTVTYQDLYMIVAYELIVIVVIVDW